MVILDREPLHGKLALDSTPDTNLVMFEFTPQDNNERNVVKFVQILICCIKERLRVFFPFCVNHMSNKTTETRS